MGRQGDATSAGHRFRPRRLWRAAALVGVGTVALFAFGGGSALAGNVHPFLETFGSANQPSFAGAAGLAIDQSNGDVLVIERGAGAISRYHEDGTPAPFSALGTNVIGGLSFGGAPEVQIAVDESGGPARGDIYATQGGAGLDVFGADGSLRGQLTESSTGPFGEICGVGVDPSGAVYVSDFLQKTIHKYVPSGNPPSNADNTANFATTSGGPCTVAAGAGTTAGFFFSAGYLGALTKYEDGTGEPKYEVLGAGTTTETVDPASGNVYVASGSEVMEYDASGPSSANLLSTISLEGGAEGVAVNGATGNVYVAVGERIDVYGPAVLLPGAFTGPASEVTNTTAKIIGGVNPEGTETSYQFEYGTSRAYGEKTPVPTGSVGEDSSFHLEEAKLSGLQPNTTYHYRIDAINTNGTATGADQTFTTTGPPLVETTGSPIRTATTAHLEGRVDPEGAATSYHFEYGTAGPCDANPCADTESVAAGEGNEIELVSKGVGGLAPGTTYHYRLVADNGNSSGPAYGEDMTVTTQASDASLSHGDFPGPPGSDRAWEQVSPPDTGGNLVSLTTASAFADNGDRAVYDIAGGTDGANAGSAASPYFSERTSNGWWARPISPSREEAPGNVWGWPAGRGDLSSFVLTNHNNQVGAPRSLWSFAGVAPATKLAAFEPGQLSFSEVSDDASRVLAGASGSLDPSRMAAAGTRNLYDVSSGTPRLIDLLPDEAVPDCGINEDFLFGMKLSGEELMRGWHWLSPDGSLAYFSSSGDNCGEPPQLYLRNILAGSTQRVSPAPLSGPQCGAAFIKATPGSVFFWTQSRLVSEDTAISGHCTPPTEAESAPGGDVYRYDVGKGEVTCITCVAPGIEADVFSSAFRASEAIGVAEDGSRVYFQSPNRLLPGAATPGFYRVEVATGNIRYIAPAEPGSIDTGSFISGFPPAGSAMNPNGSVIVFRSAAAGLNPVEGTNNGGTIQYYRYDDRDRSLTCASCPQDGNAPAAGARLNANGLVNTYSLSGPNVTPLDEAGDFFFSTPNALVPADQNTAGPGQEPKVGTDIYEWRDGRLFLVTDGLTSWHGVIPYVAGVDPSGRDVFFLAGERLTPDALDAYPRLYDARIGGGFTFPQPAPPCPLEACQGTPRGTLESVAPATAVFSGAGNLKSHHHKKRHRHRKRHHRHHKKHSHRSNQNRRQAR